MPRYTSIKFRNGKVVVVINHIEHTLTKPAFVELMTEGLRVLQALERTKENGDD